MRYALRSLHTRLLSLVGRSPICVCCLNRMRRESQRNQIMRDRHTLCPPVGTDRG